MKFICYAAVAALWSSPAFAFSPSALQSSTTMIARQPSRLFSSPEDEQKQQAQGLFQKGGAGGSTSEMMKAAAEQMKNIKPGDLDRMVEEMGTMNPLQLGALKAMGMDPAMMKKTMEMMRDNPNMVESAQKLMQDMTPEQLMDQSRMAQERMKTMTPDELEKTSKVMSSIPQEQINAAVDIMTKDQSAQSSSTIDAEMDDDDDDESSSIIATGPGTSSDPAVVDAMFQVAELLSDPPTTTGCTFAGFASVPVIQLLSGDRDQDLSMAELKECWANGSLGATRVNREGFERVWVEVQEYFEDDIMGEARKEAKTVGNSKTAERSAKPTVVASTTPAAASPATTIGDNLTAEQMASVNDRVKDMSDGEVETVLGLMEDMDPVQEARMRAMGVDPTMMAQTAKMMKDNPMMREAAQKMMKNMSPEQMLQASQQAQQQMNNMSPEDIKKAMEQMNKK